MSNMDLVSELTDAHRKLECLEAERQHAEKVQSGLYRMAELARAAHDTQKFYRAVHEVVGTRGS